MFKSSGFYFRKRIMIRQSIAQGLQKHDDRLSPSKIMKTEKSSLSKITGELPEKVALEDTPVFDEYL